MRLSGAKPHAKLFPVLLLISLAGLSCAPMRSLRGTGERTAATVLNSYLGRGEGWRSLSATMKLAIRLEQDDVDVAAKGHLMYLIGERYEVGFSKPYNRFLGNFYITPAQFVYWDANNQPAIFGLQDTVMLAALMPLGLPNWDPRDLLPFPVSGRTSGFRTDSLWTERNRTYMRGEAEGAVHLLELDLGSGVLVAERVDRPGRDPILKSYRRTRRPQGWPVPTRVTVSDPAGRARLTWSLSRIQLDADDYHTYAGTSGLNAAGSADEH